jgi:hypothetical protein
MDGSRIIASVLQKFVNSEAIIAFVLLEWAGIVAPDIEDTSVIGC